MNPYLLVLILMGHASIQPMPSAKACEVAKKSIMQQTTGYNLKVVCVPMGVAQ